MAEPVIVTWNPANMITVCLMVLLGYFIVASISKTIQQRKAA